MNYFEFYDIPLCFEVDEARLKRIFLKNSRKFHPDFHTGASEEEQEEMLAKSTLNNEAYKTLRDADLRMKYILEITGTYKDGDKSGNALPNDFLMDMMEINEALMELEFEPNPTELEKVKKSVQFFENELVTEVSPSFESFKSTEGKEEELKKIKIFYLKRKYLLRIKEKLFTFASASEKEH